MWGRYGGRYNNFGGTTWGLRGITWGSYGVVMTMSEAQHGVVILT